MQLRINISPKAMEKRGADHTKPFILNLDHSNKLCSSDMSEGQKGIASLELPLTSLTDCQVSPQKEEITEFSTSYELPDDVGDLDESEICESPSSYFHLHHSPKITSE